MNIEELRSFCNSLPGVREDIKWGHDLCFCIGEKMFCVTGLEGNPVGLSFKVRDDEFEDVSVMDGFIPAPYLARNKWVYLKDTRKVSRKKLEEYIRGSYELIKAKLPRKALRELGLS
jgi:predicted DNA-binding protein (MmcQ/YjbR family)